MVIALGLTSCDDFEYPNPPAQSNPQESILKTDDVLVSSPLEGSYNLYDLNATGTAIDVARVSCDNLPAAYTLDANVEISNNGFYTSYPVTSEVYSDGNEFVVSVNPDVLEGVYRENITKDPKENTIQLRVSVMTVTGKQIAYVGGKDYYYGPFDITLVPYTPDYTVEEAYYLVTSANNWSLANAYKLSNSGISPYDDPTFSVAIDITNDQADAGFEWKIIPASTLAAGSLDGNDSYGVDGPATDMEGSLALNNGKSGKITIANQYLITANMKELTYAITVAVPFLYTPGDSNGWSQTASQMLYTNDYSNYYGYAHLSGGFKFTNAPDWDHINYGAGAAEGQLSEDGGAGNLSAPANALFWCHVNTPALSYELTEIKTIGVIGDATPNGWDASTALTPSDDFLTWSGDIDFKGGEFKFRANDGWDVNLGGNIEDLTQDGANLASPGEGKYHVVLNLSQLPYSAQVTKK